MPFSRMQSVDTWRIDRFNIKNGQQSEQRPHGVAYRHKSILLASHIRYAQTTSIDDLIEAKDEPHDYDLHAIAFHG